MSVPTISVINLTRCLSDRQVQTAVRAVNRQIAEDFALVWGATRHLRQHSTDFDPEDEDSLDDEPVPGEGVVYLVEEATLSGALAHHDLNSRAMPVGFVFVLDPHDWTVSLSHEVLELIMDPTVNMLVPGPDPRDPRSTALHAYEVCDAVERTSYEIDGVRVSNFVTPRYFTPNAGPTTRNDFLGIGVPSFGVTQGSHIGFLDMAAGTWITMVGQFAPQSPVLAKRSKLFDHLKPVRPDRLLQQVLSHYQRSPHRKAAARWADAGLHTLQGISRSVRYRAMAEKLFEMKLLSAA